MKLGFYKNFVKGVDQSGSKISYLRQQFPSNSDAKIKAEIFIGPEIQNLTCDKAFGQSLCTNEKAGWEYLYMIAKNFLDNRKSPNYAQIITDFLKTYLEFGARMSLEAHFLHSHLDFFPTNLGDNSNKHKRFHQEIKEMESCYQRKFISWLMI